MTEEYSNCAPIFKTTEEHKYTPSPWKCEMFGSGPYGVIFCPQMGNEPNWFWRKMQYLCFGNKWIKTK